MQAPSVAHDSVRSEGRSRRPASLSIGRTHFSVHPAAVSPDPTSAKHRTAFVSSDELRPAPWSHITAEYTQDAEKKVASRLNEGSPAGSSPAPLSQAAQAAFEAAPRNATFAQLLPILSRLPEGDVDGKDRDRRESGPDYTLERGVPHTHARLPELDEPGRALHAALHAFRPVTADYALGYVSISSNFDTDSAPIAPHPVAPTATAAECPVFTPSRSAKAAAALAVVKRVFNWSKLPDLPKDMAGEFYGVAFRSVRKLGSESLNLYEADRMAHEEAVASGGLIMYWYGAPDPRTGENLATCVWSSRAAALRASALPLHAQAARHARPAYAVYDLTRYAVRKLPGEIKLRIETWDEEEAGF